ncbi:MAG TPA: sulfate ABC transporter permease subunit CysT [Myxococcaceae bacterium]|nr:sulfate ABC transporter permease subunit CysT [Myxococcaceae bacterium]
MLRRRVLPGFGLSFGITWLYLGLIVLLPLSALLLKGASMDASQAWAAISGERALASYRLSFGAALAAAGVDVVLGVLVAWVLARYSFPGRGLVDALVDFPFALPTAVAGLTLTALWTGDGWFGRFLEPLGVKVAFAPTGVVVALVFVGFPFVVRTVQPVLEDLDPSVEEAAAVLGANRPQAILRVIVPHLIPAVLTGFALSFARGVGEYGSIVFISGNLPLRTEISPLLIVTRLEQYDYGGAAVLALVLLAASFGLLLIINLLQRWSARRLELAAVAP